MKDITISEKICKIVWKLRVEWTDERFEKAIVALHALAMAESVKGFREGFDLGLKHGVEDTHEEVTK